MARLDGVLPRRVTLAQVARAAGLSQTAVSLALNRSPEECHLSVETRQKALEAAHRLGYRPNWRARALAKRQTFTIGMVYARQAPFMTAVNETIVTALSETLHSAGYHQLLVPLLGGPEDWRDVIRPDRLDGCIVLFPMPPQLGQILEETTTPMVMINLLSDLPVPQVLPDDRRGTELLMEHLFELGHKDIAIVYGAHHSHFSATMRRETYERMMREAGLGDRINVISLPTVEPMVDDFVSGRYRPTAAICFDHVLAINMLKACAERGVRVPDDLSIATFNDVYPVGHVIPPLTSVALPGEQLGRTAGQMLLKLIAQRRSEKGSADVEMRTWLPERLVIRNSTAAPRQSE